MPVSPQASAVAAAGSWCAQLSPTLRVAPIQERANSFDGSFSILIVLLALNTQRTKRTLLRTTPINAPAVDNREENKLVARL
jgi:hypothetical protein